MLLTFRRNATEYGTWSSRTLAITLCLLSILPPSLTWAQSANRPTSAQQALERGFRMAQQKQWPLAIKYFRQAQGAAPLDGPILFNLALALDKAGGHDLIAAAWYRAFLAAEPSAKTAPQVQKRLLDLDVASEVQIQRLLTTAHQAAGQIVDRAEIGPALERIARAEAESGDVAQAERTVQGIGDINRAAWALAEIAAAHAHAGNMEKALGHAKSIRAAAANSWAMAEITVAAAQRGDFQLAAKTVDNIKLAVEKAWALSRVCALQARAGDLVGATALLDRIEKNMPAARAVALAAVARAQSKAGLPWAAQSARSLLTDAMAAAEAATNFAERAGAFRQIAGAYATAGDRSAADGIVARMADGPDFYLAKRAIANVEGSPTAKIYRWSALAVKGESIPQLEDMDGLLRSVQAQAPSKVVSALAVAAEERSRFLRELRRQD